MRSPSTTTREEGLLTATTEKPEQQQRLHATKSKYINKKHLLKNKTEHQVQVWVYSSAWRPHQVESSPFQGKSSEGLCLSFSRSQETSSRTVLGRDASVMTRDPDPTRQWLQCLASPSDTGSIPSQPGVLTPRLGFVWRCLRERRLGSLESMGACPWRR